MSGVNCTGIHTMKKWFVGKYVAFPCCVSTCCSSYQSLQVKEQVLTANMNENEQSKPLNNMTIHTPTQKSRMVSACVLGFLYMQIVVSVVRCILCTVTYRN